MTLLCVFPVCSLEEKLFYCLMLMVCISGHVMKSWFNTCQSPSGGWWLPVFLLPCSLILTCRLPLSCLRDLSCWLYSPTSRLHPPVVWWVAGISTVWRVWDCKEMCACVSCLIFKPVCRRVWNLVCVIKISDWTWDGEEMRAKLWVLSCFAYTYLFHWLLFEYYEDINWWSVISAE